MTAHYPHATISKLFARPPRRRARGGLTTFQRAVLAWLDDQPRRVAAGYVWPEDVRRDPSLAERVYWTAIN